jgi:hypothetical protein
MSKRQSGSTLNNMTTVVDTTTLRMVKPWFLIEWIFNATEMCKKYYKAVKCERDKIINAVRRARRMREIAGKRGQNEEKASLMENLIHY